MKKEIRKELEEFSPFLSKIEKKEQYEMPFNYFENLADQVIGKANPQEKEISWMDTLIQRIFSPKVAMGLATSILFIAGIWLFSKNEIKTENYETIANQITTEEFNEYIIEEIDDFPIETLTEMDIDFSVSFDEIESIDDELLDEILEDFEDFELEQI